MNQDFIRVYTGKVIPDYISLHGRDLGTSQGWRDNVFNLTLKFDFNRKWPTVPT